MLDMPQWNVAFWEQSKKPPRSDLLPKMADVLGIGIVNLLNSNGGRVTMQPSSRPPGKLRKAVEDVSRLPCRQQEHIVRVISSLVMQYEQSTQERVLCLLQDLYYFERPT
jgi:hypothetical protein